MQANDPSGMVAPAVVGVVHDWCVCCVFGLVSLADVPSMDPTKAKSEESTTILNILNKAMLLRNDRFYKK